MLRVMALLLIVSCGQKNPTPDVQDGPPSEQAVEAPAPSPDGAPEAADGSEGAEDAAAAAQVTPASLYEECRGRVEGRETAGECETDADCQSAGCSQEVCTTKALAAEVMSTCEVRPCFSVLDTCGCNDGVCAWSLKDTVPPFVEGAAPPTEIGGEVPPNPPGQ